MLSFMLTLASSLFFLYAEKIAFFVLKYFCKIRRPTETDEIKGEQEAWVCMPTNSALFKLQQTSTHTLGVCVCVCLCIARMSDKWATDDDLLNCEITIYKLDMYGAYVYYTHTHTDLMRWFFAINHLPFSSTFSPLPMHHSNQANKKWARSTQLLITFVEVLVFVSIILL